MTEPTSVVRGIRIYAGFLSDARQAQIRDCVREIARDAPLKAQITPGGKRMSVQMTSSGTLGWVSDLAGYRYEARQGTGRRWPEIPEAILRIWREVAEAEREPDCCLVNFYGEGTRMGMHRDADEAEFRWPVISISLGDEALFRIGNLERGGATESVWLKSGDVVRIGGDARLRYHGIDRIRFGSSSLLAKGGRLNLTLRVAGPAAGETGRTA